MRFAVLVLLAGCLPDEADPTFGPCGDGHLDPGESCDDGNTIGGDGCSARCEFEALLTTTWEVRTAAGVAQGCAAGADTAIVTSQEFFPCQTAGCTAALGRSFTRAFACGDGSGAAMLPIGQYLTTTQLTGVTGAFATSIAAIAHVTDQVSTSTVATEIVTDGGYFTLRWNLPVMCGSVNADFVRVHAAGSGGAVDHDFDCQQFTPLRFTDALPAGTYDVTVSLESPEGRVGQTAVGSETIAGPSKVTDLGTVVIMN